MESSNFAVATGAAGSSALKQGLPRRGSGAGACRDVWVAARTGSIHDVELALASLKKSNCHIDTRNAFGSTALHIATWRNHIPIVRCLLAAGANPDARDGESGWSSLHRSLHFGHLAVAGVLIEAGASLLLEDTKGRTPVDLLSGPVQQSIANPNHGGATEVFSWGNGANYQLGTGTAGIQRIPSRIDALQGLDVMEIAAAKFHSVAVTANGEVYSWGFGRGGRLGHPDFDIHSGQVAVITPRQVLSGLGARSVRAIAVAKHHTIAATDGGEVYTWGSNREGRLGYPSVDSQPTPRRVSTLRPRVMAVAAANKHSAVLTEGGEVFTWGCNRDGQLGYGTSNSASNCIPRSVEYLKGRKLVAVATAKYHSIVLGAEGEVLAWGYKMVNPCRVAVVRSTRKAGSQPLKFHRADRLHVVAIAAGMSHSTVVTEEGLIFYWVSADPHLRCHQLISMAGHQAVAVAAGKYRTAIATSTGSVYAWDGEKSKGDIPPVPVRVHGMKHATGLSVGENHSLCLAALYIPVYAPKPVIAPLPEVDAPSEGEESNDEDAHMEQEIRGVELVGVSKWIGCSVGVPSLKDLCQKVIAEAVVEPKNALQLLEIADSLGADNLRRHCEDLVLRNLDYILTITPTAFAQLQPSLLAEVEKALDSSSGQLWSHRLLPTPTARLPAVVDSEEDDSEACGNSRIRGLSWSDSGGNPMGGKKASEGFLLAAVGGEDAVAKQLRAVRKKLQQIDALELKQSKGQSLDPQQLAKLQTRSDLEEALLSLESGNLPPMALKSPKVSGTDGEKRSGKTGSMEEDSATPDSSRLGRRLGRRRSKGSIEQGQSVDEPLPKAEDAQGFDPKEVAQSQSLFESDGKTRDSDPFHSTPEFLSPPLIAASTSSVGFKEIAGFSTSLHGGSQQISRQTSPGVQVASKSLKKKAKKGGLSMFLSGAMEATPKVIAPAPLPPPKVEAPAWGGKQIPKGLASLRDIQTQQTAESSGQKGGLASLVENGISGKVDVLGKSSPSDISDGASSSKEIASGKAYVVGRPMLGKVLHVEKIGGATNTKGKSGGVSTTKVNLTGLTANKTSVGMASCHSDPVTEIILEEMECGSVRVPLRHFVRSSAPIAVTPAKNAPGLHPENSPPPWAGASPGTSAPSLRDIQLQQVKYKAHQRPVSSRGSPKLHSPIGSVSLAPGAGNQTPDHVSLFVDTPNRWYKPEMESPSSLRCIQIEEEAMKELRCLYKNVKLVRQVDS